jgi:hypothetical protein
VELIGVHGQQQESIKYLAQRSPTFIKRRPPHFCGDMLISQLIISNRIGGKTRRAGAAGRDRLGAQSASVRHVVVRTLARGEASSNQGGAAVAGRVGWVPVASSAKR